MVNYTCEICNKVFLQKGHFNDHVNKRKKLCKLNTILIPHIFLLSFYIVIIYSIYM